MSCPWVNRIFHFATAPALKAQKSNRSKYQEGWLFKPSCNRKVQTKLELAGIWQRMEELPRALIKERMVTVKVIVMVIMMIVMRRCHRPENSLCLSRTSSRNLVVRWANEQVWSSLTKFEQVWLSLILLPSILALCHSAMASSALPGSQVSSLEVTIVHEFA